MAVMKVLSAGLASLILLAIAAGDARQAGDQPIRFLRAIPLPHVEGRIDHLAYDPTGRDCSSPPSATTPSK
jgi:hypothetical protein